MFSYCKVNSASPALKQTHEEKIAFRYSVGRILGDGNFAVVRGCVCRTTREEYALKIIDKTKCRGKEHMIESEVSILRQVSVSGESDEDEIFLFNIFVIREYSLYP